MEPFNGEVDRVEEGGGNLYSLIYLLGLFLEIIAIVETPVYVDSHHRWSPLLVQLFSELEDFSDLGWSIAGCRFSGKC